MKEVKLSGLFDKHGIEIKERDLLKGYLSGLYIEPQK